MTTEEGLEEYPQFVLWREEENPNGGKPLKVVFDPTTGRNADPHNPAVWLSLKDAEASGQLIGFVLTEQDPYFCVDLDGQLQADGTWTQWARQMCAVFPGACVEISHSQNGLHIWGRAACPDQHRTRTKSVPGLEVYTSKRFIALGSDSVGDARTDHTATLASIISQYFPPMQTQPGAQWTDGPVEEWSGPADDDELIRKMLASRASAKAAMFGGATPQDLWTANAEKLATVYPDPVRDFDHSAADAALCATLAFWTGKDCARMDRLFRKSALMRPKWDRDGYKPTGYLCSTITGANAITNNVFKKREMPPAVEYVETNPVTPGAEVVLREGEQFLGVNGLLEHFKGCTYIQDMHRVLVPEGSQLKPEQFKAMFGGYNFALDHTNKLTKDAWEAFTQSRVVMFPKAHGLCFRPDLKPGAIIQYGRRRLINTYTPDMGPMVAGDVTPFLRQLELVLPDQNDRNIFLYYMAACVQHIGVKFQWWPLLQGVEGNGKTFFMKCVEHTVGSRYTHYPRASQLGGQFNGWIQNKVFIGIEEIHMRDKFELLDAMKPLVTNDRIPIEMKGLDEVTGDNRANGIMCTNYQDAMIKTANDRRYCIFFTAQQSSLDLIRDGMDNAYFSNLYYWAQHQGGYEAVSHYLRHLPIPDDYNPATKVNRAPATTSTKAAIQASLGGVEQELLAAVADNDKPGLRGGWVSSLAFAKLLDDTGIKKPNRNRRKAILTAMGYVTHPSLKNGRSPVYVMEEQGRPYLYVQATGPLTTIGPDDVMSEYTKAQGWEKAI